jgi:hypothetical protein
MFYLFSASALGNKKICSKHTEKKQCKIFKKEKKNSILRMKKRGKKSAKANRSPFLFTRLSFCFKFLKSSTKSSVSAF